MKKIKYLFPVILLVIVTLFSSCKKYDENPLIVLSSKKSRIAQTWKPYEYVKDGEVIEPGSEEGIINFSKDGNVTINYPDGTTVNGNWEFTNKKKQISWTNEYVTDIEYAVIFDGSYILKLTKKEFWLQEDDNKGIITKFKVQ